jgi:type IV secretory pathway VirJ component
VLASRGVPVVGWDSLRYFWEAKNPDIAARDLARIIQHYSAFWQRPRVLLVGYSMGADALPFLLNRLPAEQRGRVASTSLLGLGSEAFFEFRVGQWLGAAEGGSPVEPEMRRLKGANVTCIFGSDESDSLCRTLPGDLAHRAELGGGHHFGGDYERLGELILGTIPGKPAG